MGLRKEVIAFIDSIPDKTLEALPRQSKSNIHFDINFRLDMQTVCKFQNSGTWNNPTKDYKSFVIGS